MNRTPVVLVHGVWLHMASWTGWTERFTAHGYDVHVVPWPLGAIGLDDLTMHYEKAVRALDTPPVVIGHSVGGLIARQLLDAGLARAAVAIAPLPSPGDRRMMQSEDLVQLPRSQFRRTVANAVAENEAAMLFDRYVVPAPRRLLIDLGYLGHLGRDGTSPASAADADGDSHRNTNSDTTDAPESSRGPLLLISGQEDRMVADAVTRAAYKRYGDSTAVTDLKQFADRGHSLVFDSGWPAVADYVLAWLAANGLTTPAAEG